MMILHDYILSSDCYKVRLLIAMLGLKVELRKINVFPGHELDSLAFRLLNPLGRIPVLEDDELVLREPGAILTYLSLRHGPPNTWLPDDPARHAEVVLWLEFASRELEPVSRLRFDAITGVGPAPAGDVEKTHAALTVLEDHLAALEITGADWLVGNAPTLADLAVFAPVALAPDAEIPLDTYPAIWRWIGRVKTLPGFIVMPGVMPSLVGVV